MTDVETSDRCRQVPWECGPVQCCCGLQPNLEAAELDLHAPHCPCPQASATASPTTLCCCFSSRSSLAWASQT